MTNFKNIKSLFFDFDGVLTDNYVYTSSSGQEIVKCSRSDGLAFDAFKKIKLPVFIVSSESNKVVDIRCKKLNVKFYKSIENKEKTIKLIASKYKINLANSLYIGNDINDLKAMKLCGFKACPIDSHTKIKRLQNIIMLKNQGGKGIAREIAEKILKLNISKILYE